MTDIVERLRDVEISIQHWKIGDFDTPRICEHAADEIERLREALQAIHNHQKRMPNIDWNVWEITRAALREKE